VVYRPSVNLFYIRSAATGATFTESWGTSTDRPAVLNPAVITTVASDADADRRADPAIWRPATGDWYITHSSSGFATFTRKTWGLSTDLPCAADFDGDARVDPCVYRPSTRTWYVLLSTTGYNDWLQPVVFGSSSSTPVPGDYRGLGAAQMAYWNSGFWTIPGLSTIFLGSGSDLPMPADYDGDGRTDPAVFRPATNQWLIATSSSEFTKQLTFTAGQAGDTPVPADYDGDGRADLATFRSSDGTWHIWKSLFGYATEESFAWGLSTDTPVPGDFDGDGAADIAVWRPSTGMWYVRNRFTFKWGQAGDVPVLKR
jgi:hypothetical protein